MSQSAPVIWIIATGSEILQGHYSDRNGPWLSARLMQVGLATARHMALPDSADGLRQGLAEGIARADVIITTGGLGPTLDDLTREVIANVWGCELAEDEEALAGIERRLRHVGRDFLPVNRVQARIPRGARLVPNHNGTAPGFYIPPAEGRASLLALPGPPRELQPMFDQTGVGLVLEGLGWEPTSLRTVVFRTAGLPEAMVNARLSDLFASHPSAELAMLFTLGAVDIRVTLSDPDPAVQEAQIALWRGRIRERLGRDNVYAEGATTLAERIGELLRERGQTVATAESCTAGLIAGAITAVPGASDYFPEGFVTYANAAKMRRLGVTPEALESRGAVSAEVAQAMAAGAREAAGADWAISVTGIAGPGGGSEEKPVGTVWFGLARPDGSTASIHRMFHGNREEVRERTVQAALDLLRRALEDRPLTAAFPRPENRSGAI